MSQQPHERTPNPADEPLTPSLGHQNPLGLHHGLGQINLQTKGLGGSSLAVLDPDIFFPNGLPEIDLSDDVTATQQSAPSPSEQATPATPSIQPQRIEHSQANVANVNQALQRQSSQTNQQPSRPQFDEHGQSNTASDNQALQQQSRQPNQSIQPQRIEHNLNPASDTNQALQRQSSQPNQQLSRPQQQLSRPQQQPISPTSSQTSSHSNPTIQPISGSTAHQSSAYYTDSEQSSDVIQRSSNEQANQAKTSPQIKPLSGQVQPTLDSSLSANVQTKELSGASNLAEPNEHNSESSQSAEPAQLGAAEPIPKVQSQSANEQQQAPSTTASNPKPLGKPTHTDVQRYFDPETESSASKNFSARTVSGSGEQVVQAKSSADEPNLDVAKSAEARLVSDAQPTHETASEDAIAQVQPSLTVSNDSISRSALEISSHADQPAANENLSATGSIHYSEELPTTAAEASQQAPSIQRSTASSSHSSQTSSTHQPPETTASGTTTPAAPVSARTSEQAAPSSDATSQKHFSNQADTVINRKVESSPTLDSPAITAENSLPISSNLASPKSTPIQRQPEASKVDIHSNLEANPDTATIVDAHSNPEINTDTTTTLDKTVTPAPQNTIHRSPLEQEAQIAEQQPAQPSTGSAEASNSRSHSDTPIQQSSAESEQPSTATRQERSFLQRYFAPEPNSSASSPASSNSPDDSQSLINQSANKSEPLNNQPVPEIVAKSESDTTINRSVEPSNISSTANSPEYSSSPAPASHAAPIQRQPSSASFDAEVRSQDSLHQLSEHQDVSIQRQPSSDGFDGDVRSHDHSSPDLNSQQSSPSPAETQAAYSDDRLISSVHPAPASDLEHLQLKPADTAQIDSTDIKETKTTNLQRQPADAAQSSDPIVEETKQVSLPVTSALNQTQTSSIQAKSQANSDDISHAASPELSEVHEAHLALPSHRASQSDSILQRDISSSATTDNTDLQTPPQIKEGPNNQTAPSNPTNTLTDRPSIASTDLPSIQAQFDQVNTQTTDQSDQLGNQQLESVPVYSNQINIQKQSDSTTNNQPNSDSSESAQAIKNELKPKKSEAQLSANQSIDFVQPKFDIVANQNADFVQSKSQVSSDQSVKSIQPKSSSDQPTKPIQKVGHAVNRLMRFFASQVNPAPNHQVNQPEHTAEVKIQKSESVNVSDIPSQTVEVQASDTESVLISHSNSSSVQRSPEIASNSTSFESSTKLDNDASLLRSSVEAETAFSAEPIVSEQLTSDAVSLKADSTGSHQHSSSELSSEQFTLDNQDTFVEHETAIAPLTPTTASQVTSNIQAKLDHTVPDNPQISSAKVSESLSDKVVQASATNFAVDSSTSSVIDSGVDIDPQTPTAAPVHASAETHTESQSTASAPISSAAETDSLSAALAELHSQPSQPVSPDILQRSEQPAAKTFTDSSPPAELVLPTPSSGSAGQPDLASDSTPALGDHFSNQLSSSLANDAIQTKADSVQSATDSISDHAATVEPQFTSAESTTSINQPSAIAADSASTARLLETPQEQPLQRQTEEASSSTASQAELPNINTVGNLDAQPTVQRTSAPDAAVSNQAEASASVEALAASANALPSQDFQILQAGHEPDIQTTSESTSQAHTEIHKVIHETHSAELRQAATKAALPGEQSMLQRQLSTEVPDLNPTRYSTDADTSAPIAPSAGPPSVQRATEVPDLNPISYSTDADTSAPIALSANPPSVQRATEVLGLNPTSYSTDADTSAPAALPADSPSVQRADQTELDSHIATSQSLAEASTEAPASSAQLLQRTTAKQSGSSSTDELSSNLSPTSQPSSSSVRDASASHQESADSPQALSNSPSKAVPDVQASGYPETADSPEALPDKLFGAAPSVQLSSASATQNSFTSVQPLNQSDTHLQHDTQQPNQQSESVEPSSSTTTSAISATPDATPIAVQRQVENKTDIGSSNLASAFTTEEEDAGAIASTSTPTLSNETVQRFSDLSAASLDSDQAAQPLNTANHNNSEHHSDSLPSAASELNLSSVQRSLADQNINQSTDAIAPIDQSSADQSSTNSPPQSHPSSEDQSAANAPQESLESLPAKMPSIQASSIQKSEDQSAANAPKESLESSSAKIPNIQASSLSIAETLHPAQFDQALPEEQPPELPSVEAPSIQASSVPTAETLHSAQFDQVLPEALSDKAPSIQASESSVTPSHAPKPPLQPQTTLDSAPLSSSNTDLQRSFSSESTSAPESVAEIEPQPQSSAQIDAALHSASTQTPSIQAQSTPINAEQPDLKHLELNQPSAQLPSTQAQPAQADSTPAGSEQSGSTYSALQPSSTQVPSVQAKSAQTTPEQSPEQLTVEHLDRPLQSLQPPSIQAKSEQEKAAHVAADPNQQVDPTPITVLRPIGVLRSLTTTPISTSAIQAKASQSEPSQQLSNTQSHSSNQNIDSNLSSSYQAQSYIEKGLAANVEFSNSTASQPTIQRQPEIADYSYDHAHHEPGSITQFGQRTNQSSDSYTATPETNQAIADVQRQSTDSTHQVDLTQTVLDGIGQAANRDRTSNSTAQPKNGLQPVDSPTISQVRTDQPHQPVVNRSLADVADSVDSVIDQQSKPSQSLSDTPSSQGFSTPTAYEAGHQLDSYQAGTYNLQASPQANQSSNPPAAQLNATPIQPNLVQREDAEQSEQARPTQIDQASTHVQRAQAADAHQAIEPLTEYIQPVNSQPNNIQRDQLSDSSQLKATAQPVQPFTQAQPSHIQRTQAASAQPSDSDQDAGVPTQWSSLADLVDQTQRLSAPTPTQSSPEKASSIPKVQRQVDLPSVAEPKNIQDSATDAVPHEAATPISPAPSASIPTQWSSLEDLVQKMPSLEPAADSPMEEATKAISQMPQIQRQSLSQEKSRSSQNPASPSPKPLQSKSQSTLQPVRQPSKPRSTLSVSRVAPLRSQSAPSTQTTVQAKFSQSRTNSAMLIQAAADEPFVTISRSGDSSEPSADYAKALELLAQEIYSLLRQRLAIEQERHGAGYPNRFR